MGTTTTVFIAILLTINIITIVLYTIDKRRAKKGQWRISEKVLLIWALFAPWGAYTGMKLAHHKTQNKKIYSAYSAIYDFALFTCLGLYLLQAEIGRQVMR